MGKPSEVFALIDQYLQEAPAPGLSVKELCEIHHVSRSGYYRWKSTEGERQAREARDRADFALILEAYKAHGRNKGARSIHMELLHQGIDMNLKKIRRLMHKYNLCCPIRKQNPYRQMAKALRTSNVADNLVKRQFEAYGPRQILLTDITYIPYNGRFAYLSTILDAYTRQILAYVVSDSLEVDFVLQTVDQLIEKHGDELCSETVIHSDQGCHYTSHRFIQILKDRNLRQSMSRKGNCWDNAPQESFFGHMKDEIRDRLKQCSSFEEIKALLDEQIDYYNTRRYQWKLAKLSPDEFYQYWKTGDYPLRQVQLPKAKLNQKPVTFEIPACESK